MAARREARLKEQLRANLLRRKQQARARKSDPVETDRVGVPAETDEHADEGGEG